MSFRVFIGTAELSLSPPSGNSCSERGRKIGWFFFLALSKKVERQLKPAVECMISIPMTLGYSAFCTIWKQETVVQRTKEPTEKPSPHIALALTLASSILEYRAEPVHCCHLIPTSPLPLSRKDLSGHYSKCTQSSEILVHSVSSC